MTAGDRAWVGVAVTLWLFVGLGWSSSGAARVEQTQGPASVVTAVASGRIESEARGELLDTPVLPGSVMKAWTLVAALESGVIEARTSRVCRRIVTVDGRRYVCAHPDLKRPLTPAEALAHSCNDYFVSLAPRLPRAMFDSVRLAAGLPALGGSTPLAAGLVGLDGPRIAPRALMAALVRLVGAQASGHVPMRGETRQVLLNGLRGASQYGSAAALSSLAGGALAKTGTAPMPGGGVMGLVVALAPEAAPTRAVVVALPGAAGRDAAGVAADLFVSTPPPVAPPAPTPPPAAMAAPSAAAPRNVDDAALRHASAGTTVRLGVTSGRRVRVESVALEEYVARVLAGEGQPRAGDAAQQALAVAARTFTIANRGRHAREGYDVCDTTHCQVVRPSTPVTRSAALASAGRLLLASGAPAYVFYSALCGGRPERASEVWPGAIDYGELAHEDDACQGEPPWASDIPASGLERALRAAGFRGSRLRELRVVQQNASGRVTRLRIDGFSPNEISGQDLRMAVGRVLGWQHLRSTIFDLRRTSAGYRFAGRGFGHGVGLCVIGAGHRAARGESVDDILGFYYPGLQIGTAGSTTTPADARPAPSTTANPVPAPRPSPVPAATDDVRLALPAGEEHERAAILALVRTARDEIVRRAGVTPPAVLTLTFHPSVDAFGRATGQPWWASASTRGARIDLLPLALLRQQGQIERTIRHEVAHAIVDGSLSGRPLWVREGAAIFFADSAPDAATRPPRVECPSDIEIARPVSAGAQRDAYARAEQCFLRQIADGRRWDEVR